MKEKGGVMKKNIISLGVFVFFIVSFTFIFNVKTTLSMGLYIYSAAGGMNSSIHSNLSYSDKTVGTSDASESTYRSTTGGNGGFYTEQTFTAFQNTGAMQATNDTYKYAGSVDHVGTKEIMAIEGLQAVGDYQVALSQSGVGSGTFLREGEHHTDMAAFPFAFVRETVNSAGNGYLQVGATAHFGNYVEASGAENGGSFAPPWSTENVNEIGGESLKFRLGQHGLYMYNAEIEIIDPNYTAP